MGISGLLPLLKPIQVNKHLSEFSGQTLAVDAYVWLHRGIYACAADIATGKRTHKYVDYAMHRVRLLRHHNIQPYIVFDGGPLPAKKGTESERKQRRDENLARANALAAQGKHSQAREYYVKCVDVTPQMAYQLIKALRAENVPYVVAPYEADAQLAYLERIGIVDGIITEDSDLLVFGCKTVLFKMDAVASTISCVSRADFAGLAADAGGVSLLGWSDVQFRAMAILSGCDYLPSIPGVGLKTAWSLLRKHKTVENVVRALKVEGKKKVPKGYLEAFRLAEKVFLHQRVYDPTQETLVHLTELPAGEEWDQEKEAHVGGFIEPVLAKRIAEGDWCPVTFTPMDDINPSFIPRALKAIPMNIIGLKLPKDQGKGKMKAQETPRHGSILQFFTPQSKPTSGPKSPSQHVMSEPSKTSRTGVMVGKSSGKRTLAEIMDNDIAVKRKKQGEQLDPFPLPTSSRFFGAPPRSMAIPTPRGHKDANRVVEDASAGPSHVQVPQEDKENARSPREDVEDIDVFTDAEITEEPDLVEQEDGYISPSPSFARCITPDFSSPLRPRTTSAVTRGGNEDDFDADVLSSPPVNNRARVPPHAMSRDGTHSTGRILARETPSPCNTIRRNAQGAPGPDLRDTFGDCEDLTSDIDYPEEFRGSASTVASSGGLVTPEDWQALNNDELNIREDGTVPSDGEDLETQAATTRNARVANGWWDKWGHGSANVLDRPRKNVGPLRRRETTMTPEGRQGPLQARPHSAQPKAKRRGQQQQDLRSTGRRSLVFHEEVKLTSASRLESGDYRARPGSSGSVLDVPASAKNRLAEFRWLA